MPVQSHIALESASNLWSNDLYNVKIKDLTRASYPLYDHFDDLKEDIAKNGIMTPLRVVNDRLVDGHHRMIVAMELGLQEIPVEYSGKIGLLSDLQ